MKVSYFVLLVGFVVGTPWNPLERALNQKLVEFKTHRNSHSHRVPTPLEHQ